MSPLRNLPLQLVLVEESASGQNLPTPPAQGSNQRWQRRVAGALLLLFCASLLKLSAQSYSPFLYFQF